MKSLGIKPDKLEEIEIDIAELRLYANVYIPAQAQAMVLFAHGSGSGRHSKRNNFVAGVLNEAGFATLLMDLLTRHEEVIDEQTMEYRFDIGLLADRVVGVTDWLRDHDQTSHMKLGYFGASTGAAAALVAASQRPDAVSAIVSRGGRPDLAQDVLEYVKAPTLLLVGGWDDIVIAMNKLAASKMKTTNELVIIPAATHLFEEPGKLEEVAAISAKWFKKYLTDQ